MISENDIYSSRIFINSVLPLMAVLANEVPDLKKKFEGKSGIVQVSVLNDGGKIGMHFEIENGSLKTVLSVVGKPDVELEFASIPLFNDFFKGKSKKLPKIRGIFKLGLFVPTIKTLLYMAKLLGMTAPPDNQAEKELLVKLYFYLLSSGISQLNKAGHPRISEWAGKSPDRVYAWGIEGRNDISAYIRVKAGKTKASRGKYTYAKPFFTMCFDNVDSALGTLLGTDDLMEATANGRLIMEGAPEFGSQIGDYMMIVGGLAK